MPPDLLTSAEIAAVLDKLSGAKVAVVGDFCLDAYWTVNPDASKPGARRNPYPGSATPPGARGMW